MKIVKVIWVDAETIGDSGWQEICEVGDSIESAPPVMQSVGFLLGEYDTHITITDSVGDKEYGHITKIPAPMIRYITYMQEPSAHKNTPTTTGEER